MVGINALRKSVDRPRSFRPRVEVLEDRTLLSAGSLDPTFGTGGQVLDTYSGDTALVNAMARQGDGKLVVAGGLQNARNFFLERFNADGSPDTTFGSDPAHPAQVITPLDTSGSAGVANAVAIQPDGKIVAAGTYSSF